LGDAFILNESTTNATDKKTEQWCNPHDCTANYIVILSAAIVSYGIHFKT